MNTSHIVKYVAAPGAGDYNYILFAVKNTQVVRQIILGNDDPSMYAQVWIYRGSVTSYGAANNAKCLFIARKIQAAGTSYPAYDSYICFQTYVILPPGDYTFAFRTSVAQTHVVGILHMEDHH